MYNDFGSFSSVNCIVYLSVYKSFRQALFTFKRLSNSPKYPMEISCSRAEENVHGGSRYVYYICKYPKKSYQHMTKFKYLCKKLKSN